MRAYIIKRKGKTWLGNMLLNNRIKFSSGDEIFFDNIFYRKKDAKLYLQLYFPAKYRELFEVIGVTIDESKRDNRRK